MQALLRYCIIAMGSELIPTSHTRGIPPATGRKSCVSSIFLHSYLTIEDIFVTPRISTLHRGPGLDLDAASHTR